MEYFSVNDIYEIRLASLISNIDKDVIIELYQPLIGSISTILYLSLLKQKRKEILEDEKYFYQTKQLVKRESLKFYQTLFLLFSSKVWYNIFEWGGLWENI